MTEIPYEGLDLSPFGATPDGKQSHFWTLEADVVAAMPPRAGVTFPGQTGLLRPYRPENGSLWVLDQDNLPLTVPFASTDPGAPIRYHGRAYGLRKDEQHDLISFVYYKAQRLARNDDEPAVPPPRETVRRLVLASRIGYGLLKPGHEGERGTYYLHGFQIATLAPDQEVELQEQYPVNNKMIRNFSLPRMGLFGDLNDPQQGVARRLYWGVAYVPDAI